MRRRLLNKNKSLLPETQAIIDRALSESFAIPNQATINHINSLIKELKDIGYWQKRDLILNKAYNDTNLKDFTRINWKNPSGTLGTYVGGLLYTVGGSQGTATSGDYYNTNYNYSTDLSQYTLDDAGRDFVVYDSGSSHLLECASNNNTTERIGMLNTTAQRINQGNNTLNTFANLSGNGYKSINRVSDTDVIFFNNDVQLNRTATSTIVQNGTILLHTLQGSYGDATISFYSAGKSIVSESQDFRIAYNKFLTNIGLSPVA